jgi:hypothetical protein
MKMHQTHQTLLGTIVCILTLNCPVRADGGFIDDFSDGDIEDGSPVMWQWVPELGPIGEQMVTPEGLHLTAEGPKTTVRSWRFARNAYGVPVQYAGNVSIRAQMKIPVDGPGDEAQNHSCVFLGLRFDVNQGTGYWVSLNSHFFWIARVGGPGVDATRGYFAPGAWHYDSLGRVDFSQDVIIQLDVKEQPDSTSLLEAYFWAAGSQKPAQPQVVAKDPHFDVGEIGIGASSMGKDRTVIVRWVEVVGNKIDPPVDFNGSGQVDIKDLVKMIESWGQDDPALDLVPDGVVDAQDLEVLMDYWQEDVDDMTLLSNWTLDETEGIVAANTVSEKQGIVLGNPVWQPESGQVQGCLAFDGIDDMIIGNASVNPEEGPFSVFAWIKGGAAGQVIVSQQTGVNWLKVDTDGTLMTALTQSGGRTSGAPLYSETVITDGNWHRIGLVWNGAQRILYVDDIPVALDSQSDLAGSAGGLIIGAGTENQAGSFWTGLIDDIRIYDRVVKP